MGKWDRKMGKWEMEWENGKIIIANGVGCHAIVVVRATTEGEVRERF